MFLQHFTKSSNLSGRPCFRGLLRVQVASGSKPQALQRLLQDLRGAGHVLVYPAHQFAVQALMGISSRQTLDLNSDACGKAFMDLLIEDL
jgi:hypothetical protein